MVHHTCRCADRPTPLTGCPPLAQDVLAVQERELKRRFEMAHEDRLRAERQKYHAELAGVMGELKGLKDAITGVWPLPGRRGMDWTGFDQSLAVDQRRQFSGV